MKHHRAICLCLFAAGWTFHTVQVEARKSVPMIVGGRDAASGRWPWIVSLEYNGGFHFCTGSIVSSDWVLTASHCLEGMEPGHFKVVVGTNNIKPDKYESTVQVRGVSALHLHPTADFALVQLNASLDESINGWECASLAPDDGFGFGYTGGLEAWAAGWGATYRPNGAGGALQEAQVDVLESCVLRADDHAEGSAALEWDICAKDIHHGRDSVVCFGDSGGPLNVLRDGVWRVTGVSVYVYVDSDGRCIAGAAMGYARVSEKMDFVCSYEPNAVGC